MLKHTQSQKTSYTEQSRALKPRSHITTEAAFHQFCPFFALFRQQSYPSRLFLSKTLPSSINPSLIRGMGGGDIQNISSDNTPLSPAHFLEQASSIFRKIKCVMKTKKKGPLFRGGEGTYLEFKRKFRKIKLWGQQKKRFWLGLRFGGKKRRVALA